MSDCRLNPSTGFTLVELLIVLVILSVLAGIGLPLAEMSHRRQKEEELRTALRQIRDSIDAYKKAADTGRIAKRADESGYPSNLRMLVDGVIDQTDPVRTKLYFLRRIPADPFREDSLQAADQSWGLRSYASEPDDPRAGKDVFDVYSRGQGVGINGIAYRKW